MKINITFTPQETYSYTNFSILKNQTFELKDYDFGELEEIVVTDVIEYIPKTIFEGVLKGWISKLAIGGKIVLSFIDIREVNRLFYLQRLNLAEFNTITHGGGTEIWQNKHLNFSLDAIAILLQQLGLKLVSTKLNNLTAVIIGERP